MTEIEQLVLQVESRGLTEVNRQLQESDRNAKKTSKSWGTLGGQAKAIGAGLLAIGAGALWAANKLKVATQTYQDYNAQLKNITKSQEGATEAYEALINFAAETPYSVAQATESFVKLVNLGLNPSERALRSYGNTAKAMNFQLSDMVEAVSDATNGEFDTLKKFGIGASVAGDKITLAFQGTSKTVKRTKEEIQKFLMDIGENQFAGVMKESMGTLTGVISNMEDTWDQLWTAMARKGPDTLITRGFQLVSDSLTELLDELKSGELEAYIEAVGGEWLQFGKDAQQGLSEATDSLRTESGEWKTIFGDVDVNMRDVFTGKFPNYLRAAIQSTATYLDSAKEKVKVYFNFGVDTIKNNVKQLEETLALAGRTFTQPQMIFGEAESQWKRIRANNEEARNNNKELLAEQATDLNASTDLVLDDYAEQANADNALFDVKTENRKKLRADYDADKAKQKADTRDKLAKYEIKGDPTALPPVESKADKRNFDKQLEDLEHGLATENQVVANSYDGRKDLILANEESTQAQKKSLALAALSESLMTEADATRIAYDARREFILSATELTEEQRTNLLTRLTTAREKALADIERKSMAERLDMASTFFGNIASIGSTFGEKGFKIAKAAAIAQATIKTYAAATGAYSAMAGIPYIGPALGVAAAGAAIVAGAANIAQIKSQQYSGNYATGGMIPAGKYGLVGEAGPEIVNGPAVVTSAASTRAKGSGVASVTINNNGAPVSATSQMNGDDLLVILEPILAKNSAATRAATKKDIASEIQKGGTPIAAGFEKTYGLRRNTSP